MLPLLVTLLLSLAPNARPAVVQYVWAGVERVVAVGDVHGDFGQFTAVLRDAGLIDQRDRWSGGKAHLVQVGDVPDRGPDTRKIMDFLMRLEGQARKAGLLLPESSSGLLAYLREAAALDPAPSPLLPLIQKLERVLPAGVAR